MVKIIVNLRIGGVSSLSSCIEAYPEHGREIGLNNCTQVRRQNQQMHQEEQSHLRFIVFQLSDLNYIHVQSLNTSLVLSFYLLKVFNILGARNHN